MAHIVTPIHNQRKRYKLQRDFEDTDVKDRSLSDWQGIWESVNPLLLNGKLDEVLESKAKKNKDKTVEEYREYYKKVMPLMLTVLVLKTMLLSLLKMVL